MNSIQRITPFLWFDKHAEEATEFYVSIFKDSKIEGITHYGEAAAEVSGVAKGTVMTVAFELDGQKFTALNGGPAFKFNEAVSFVVNCDTQLEIDEYWEKLSAGGEPRRCGWLKDKFGVSWQIVPAALSEILLDKDPRKSENVMKAILQMDKLDLQTLRSAYRAKP